MRCIKSLLPHNFYLIAQRIVNAKRVLTAHSPEFFCLICDSNTVGVWTGFDTNLFLSCSKCFSLSRQRLVAKWSKENRELIEHTKNILHFAAEPYFKQFFIELNNNVTYSSADLYRQATMNINIENTGIVSDSYCLVIANHVLEHVNDDNKAISEIYRILKKGGVALITVPLIYAWSETYENPCVVSPEDRDRHFGQFDHQRYYGRDLNNKFQKNGFKIQEYISQGEDCVKYGLDKGEVLYVLSKIH